jgi:4-aminobutyrate aminotransferase/(S)-3-amino-2-methylpropionate transaminase
MPSIQLRTAVPGPESQQLMKRREAAVPRGIFHATPIFVARTEGALLEDVDGNRFIDFAGGIGSMNAGHRAPRVVAAVKEQLDRFMHTCFSVALYEKYVALAEKMNAITPGTFAKKTIFVNSGAEAIENAVKIARCYTRRPAILAFEDAFHGRTLLTMSLTSKTHPYKAGFEPFAPEIYRIPYAYCYRCSYSLKYPSCETFCAHHLEDAFKRTVAAETVAAVLVEPVLGEGGFVAPPPEFFGILEDICRRHGILLIADEVQSGFARTGAMFACERYGLEPDLLACAKSIGGGLPLAAVTGRAEIMDAPGVGGIGGTFGGNPLSCAAALSAIETMEKENLSARAESLGQRFDARAKEWKNRSPLIGESRGLGAMRAIELVRSPETREPAKEETEQIVRYCYQHGLIVLSAGTYGNVIRLLVPLVITDAQFEEGLDVLEAALASVAESRMEMKAVHPS